MRRHLILVLVLLGVASIADGPKQKDTVTSANGFLASLDRTQHRDAVKPFDDDYRTLWRYTPAQRQGVTWKSMTSDQEQKALDLLRSVLSDVGIQKVGNVRELEGVLAEIERNPNYRDKDAYYFTFFGTPSKTEEWAWRYEGHHVSLNFAYKGNKLVASTPQFFGSNPAEVRSGDKKGLRMQSKEQDLAFELLGSLSESQKGKAILTAHVPGDIFTGESREAQRQSDEGVKYSELNKDQQRTMISLIKVHAEAQKPEESNRRMSDMRAEGLDDVRFAWIGSEKPGAGHYYRIQGKSFVIEYDNTQNGANHIHAVWRDFDSDFGRDMLRDHYTTSDHHKHD